MKHYTIPDELDHLRIAIPALSEDYRILHASNVLNSSVLLPTQEMLNEEPELFRYFAASTFVDAEELPKLYNHLFTMQDTPCSRKWIARLEQLPSLRINYMCPWITFEDQDVFWAWVSRMAPRRRYLRQVEGS